jgi:protein-S-isoprenylcysteine O-methyltransferase Ste14
MALFTLVMSGVLQHYEILAEEEVCLRRSGESYRAYVERVPRYGLFF